MLCSLGDTLKYAKRLSALALLCFVAISSAGYANDSLPTIDTALADCVAIAPTLETKPEQVILGGTLKIHGEDFGELVECDDTSVPGDEDVSIQFEPSKNIAIELKQGSQKWELATVDADQDLSFDKELQLPAEISPGKATVIAESNQGLGRAPISISEGVKSDPPSTNGRDVTNLPDTGGAPLGGIATKVGILLIGVGILLRRRLA
jgi:hypothetical protein